MSNEYQLKNRISDVLKWETSPLFSRDKMTVTVAENGSAVDILAGDLYVKSTSTKLVEPESAIPAVYTVTISKSGDSTADNTLIIGGVTFTAKASPSTLEGTQEYGLDDTADEIAAIVKAKGVTNYTVTVSGSTLTYTQTTAGTGSAITIGSGNDSTITAAVTTTQEYVAAVAGNVASITCITLEPVRVNAGESKDVLVLVRGPAMYDADCLNVSSGTLDSIITQLETLDLRAMRQPGTTVYQET